MECGSWRILDGVSSERGLANINCQLETLLSFPLIFISSLWYLNMLALRVVSVAICLPGSSGRQKECMVFSMMTSSRRAIGLDWAECYL